MRQNIPLPPFINRGGFYSLREEKLEAKVWKKQTNLFPCFHFFFPLTSSSSSFTVSVLPASMPTTL
jgi:hypothetical protein